jgi:hypothetical protein
MQLFLNALASIGLILVIFFTLLAFGRLTRR